ncbi:MAG: phosphoribosylglycinamide formyltransferase ['Candidatus Kapabacteria' thiocyanatum]|uniref:Phosphoribosylglycinamide formyltransferase n=1 Tax=Candidatus Kapaibacterium thiocyanatum TaxID=1895771 RepID=A0A1M3KX64_9BACT|nr:phosphoribosylglycinamide formyltransferase ['Candidatus Kapabacteria' thiocyanatum]OJX57036.1 MAG: hypothetical protein BGO89_11035 ['Candidatus Kapabacteria' thiocyanatum]
MTSPIAYHRVAVLGSGAGSNARALIRYSQSDAACPYRVVLVVGTRPDSGIVQMARDLGVESHVLVGKAQEESAGELLEVLRKNDVEVLALAGFMRLLPQSVIQGMSGHVLNIHPALLPRFGGKGMYGMHVHRAVIEAVETESGCTVHMVDGEYDRGRILGQRRVPIVSSDTPETLQDKVKEAEHRLYPEVLSSYVRHLGQARD